MASGERVLVTGGRGFLGKHLREALEGHGYSDILAPASSECDLIDQESTQALFDQTKPSYVIHAAAAVGGIGANVENPGRFSYANTMMGANVLEASRRTKVKKVVLVGTICVYPGEASVPTSEDQIFDGYPAPATAPYGIAKRNLMVMGQAYQKQYGLDSCFVIPTNLYGPHDHFEPERSHVVPALIRRMLEAKESDAPSIEVWGDGSATREFIYASDAAEGLVRIMRDYDSADPLNLGTGIETGIKELVETIKELVGYEGEIVWDTSKPSGAPRRCLDVKRLKASTGFEASTKLREGLEKTIRWFEANR